MPPKTKSAPANNSVVIYGGSFDPPHKGHTALLRAAVRKMRPWRVYVVPAFKSPFKGTAPVPFFDRFRMLKLALKAAGLTRGVKISRFEAGKKRVTRTFETIEYFRRLHPCSKLYFLLGSDCLAGFNRWKNSGRILNAAVLLAGARRGFQLKQHRGVPFERLQGVFPEISSTSLRAALLSGENSRYVEVPVMRHIEKRGLYFSRERRMLKKLLTPARYAHSLSVARLAAELAERHGEDPKKAALAGLLHDAARDFSDIRLVRYAVSKRLKVPCLKRIALHAPVLLHSYASAELARRRFGVRDKKVLRAISLHTSAAPRMDKLSTIIYVADLAAADRGFAQAKKIARLARRDLCGAFLKANYVKLKYAGLKPWKLRRKKKD